MPATRTRYFVAITAVLLIWGTLVALPPTGYGKNRRPTPEPAQAQSPEVNKIIERIITGEKQYVQNLKKYSPRVETYLQFDNPGSEPGHSTASDAYFLGRMDFNNLEEVSFIPADKRRRKRSGFEGSNAPFLGGQLYMNRFASSTMVDADNFDQQHYTFEPVGWEYLGDIRCLAIDVQPLKDAGVGAFQGRIWVEDRNYAIVRLNGVRINPPGNDFYVHFDTWRENLRRGEWLPVYIYSEESGEGSSVHYKANTRFWGYDLTAPHQRQEEWTKILVEAPAPVHENSDATADLSPVESQRQLEMEAERNVLERLEKARLIAPAGAVDKVLETVLNNLVVTNQLNNLPPLHCRVMLTAPLEAFTLRYTIVVSRGLIDVLPDEGSLAMVLAHELAHVVLGHKLDTKYFFNDRLVLADEDVLAKLDLARSPGEEDAADAKAVEFLQKSPYKDKLGNAGLFLRAAAEASPNAPHLFGAHLGDRLATKKGATRMSALMHNAPELKEAKVDQVAALPLGSRVQVDAWDGSVTFPNRKAVPLVDPSEKMPFQVSPLFPHLTRFEDAVPGSKVASRQGE